MVHLYIATAVSYRPDIDSNTDPALVPPIQHYSNHHIDQLNSLVTYLIDHNRISLPIAFLIVIIWYICI